MKTETQKIKILKLKNIKFEICFKKVNKNF